MPALPTRLKQDSFFINETWCKSESLYTQALVWGSSAHSAPSLSMNEACGGVLQARWMGQLSPDGCQALLRVTQRGGLELRPLTSKLGSVLDVHQGYAPEGGPRPAP